MNPLARNSSPRSRKIGFHYFPDTVHFTERDLQTWLPLLMELGVGWLVLRSETSRAIPEPFITGLVRAGIHPIVQFPLTLSNPPDLKTLSPLVQSYASWGCGFIQFYDRPNQLEVWQVNHWAQQDLVDRFLDRFLPLANLTVEAGAVPLFPALEPGGNFWDTAFLRAALQSMERRKQTAVLEQLALAAYGWTFNRPLNWGCGGPERWPDARPYFTPAQSQDQRGMGICDWYSAVCSAVIQKTCPIILFQAGLPEHPARMDTSFLQSAEYNHNLLDLFTWASNPQRPQEDDETAESAPSFPEEVAAVNFWLLSAGQNSPFAPFAWFDPHQPRLAAAEKVCAAKNIYQARQDMAGILDQERIHKIAHPIRHYLLFEETLNGDLAQKIQKFAPFIHQHHPTMGFSFSEARLAVRVTIATSPENIPPDLIQSLQQNGAQIDWLA
ncbi:MAG: hypothetical protein ROW48_15555 [Bellilinea sp.]